MQANTKAIQATFLGHASQLLSHASLIHFHAQNDYESISSQPEATKRDNYQRLALCLYFYLFLSLCLSLSVFVFSTLARCVWLYLRISFHCLGPFLTFLVFDFLSGDSYLHFEWLTV